MPHLVLEYTANLAGQVDHRALFGKLHATMMAGGEFRQEEIKSRAIRLDDYYIGNGDPENAFVHLKVSMLDKRGDVAMQRIAQSLLPVLEDSYRQAFETHKCQICVEAVGMQTDCYFKVVA